MNWHREFKQPVTSCMKRLQQEGLSGHEDGAHFHEAVTDVQMGMQEQEKIVQGSVLLLLKFIHINSYNHKKLNPNK